LDNCYQLFQYGVVAPRVPVLYRSYVAVIQNMSISFSVAAVWARIRIGFIPFLQIRLSGQASY
jgi:hypothetical protein